MTSEYGAASQLEKIDMLDFAELVVLNKFEKRGAEDALRDVRKQWKRNRVAFDWPMNRSRCYPTIASQFNDPGVNHLFLRHCVPPWWCAGGLDAAAGRPAAIDTSSSRPATA